MKPILYNGTTEEVQLGDFVEYRSTLFFWRWKKGRICYLPGVSKKKKSMEYSGVLHVGIVGEDGSFRDPLVNPEHFQLGNRIRFCRRTDGSTALNPMDISNYPSLAETVKALEGIKRKASEATLTITSENQGAVTSRFSGDFVMLPSESWPLSKGKPMTPLIQIIVDELPHVTEKLKPFKVITMFINSKNPPYESVNGDRWEVRTYDSLEGLITVKNPCNSLDVIPCDITWGAVEADYPALEDAERLVDCSEFEKIDDSSELYYDEFDTAESTKVGGYPAIIQASSGIALDDFVFQIGTEDEANWMLGDAGIAYIGLTDSGGWQIEWQCY